VQSGKPVQQVHEHLQVHFAETDASTWCGDELKTRLVEEAQRPLIWNEGQYCG
jgi:hypothetical protein